MLNWLVKLNAICHLGPVAGSMVNANHWLRGIETYTFL